MKTILFLCTGNSCRSQMAEGWTRKLWPQLLVYSAGSAPAREVDYLAVQAMAEKGVIISTYRPKNLRDLPPITFDLVVTLCGDAAEACPHFPGSAKVEHHGFDDPPKLALTAQNEEEALAQYRRVRDELADFVIKIPLSHPELFTK
jgi:arsenate reductase